jgi:hypothetical protein
MKALFLLSGLVAGNFLYQYTGDANYLAALERSYFQAVAILLYALMTA